MRFIAILIVSGLLFTGCKSEKKNIGFNTTSELERSVVIPSAELDKAGVNIKDSLYMSMASIDEDYYLLCLKENLLLKFDKNGKAQFKYSRAGQGPGEFMRPAKVFSDSNGNPAVFDIGKKVVLHFDKELNYIKEVKINPNIRNIESVGGQIVAFGAFDEHCFAKLDNDYNFQSTFKEIPKKAPFDKLHRIFLYSGHFLNGTLAYSSWGYYEDECVVEITDPASGKPQISLRWINPHTPTQEDINKLRNMYFCYKIGETDKHYVVQTRHTPVLKKKTWRRVRFFTKDGKPASLVDIDTDLINAEKGRLYNINSSEDIVELKLKEATR